MTQPGVIAVLLILIWLSGCQTSGDTRTASLRPGERPALDTDEAGLWMISDKMERTVRDSGRVVRDAELNSYVKDIVCRLAPTHCVDIRLQIVRVAGFNANMSPNGYMQVWTGLLLRAENEAQLAYVLGHEIAHYLKRHSVQRWRDLRAKTDAAAAFQVLTAAAGVPVVGQVGTLAAVGSIYSFSREQEREADNTGLDRMMRAGYDPREAARIWQGLLEERDAEQAPEQSIFFSSHPSGEERVATLNLLAADVAKPFAGDIGADTYRQRIEPHVGGWLRDELRRRELAASEVLLTRLLAHGGDPGELNFYRGELYRLRAGEGDLDRALDAYREAASKTPHPATVHRSMGLVLWHDGQKVEAQKAFRAYLKRAPKASDRAMVKSYIDQLGG